MSALVHILIYLLQTFLSLYLLAMLTRFLLQLVRADFYNPISQFLVKVTNPLVVPVRRVVPGLGGVDLSSLLLALVLQMAGIALILALRYSASVNIGLLLAWSVIGLLALLVNIYFFALLAMIILSWVAPTSRHPAIHLVYQVTEPVMAPFRRALPPMGGLDFSPILVFILINVIKIALQHMAAGVHMPAGLVLGF